MANKQYVQRINTCRANAGGHCNMILNTRRLFIRLLRQLEVDVVCDVGSMDGADALRFRQARSKARIYALEPNPENFRRMAEDPLLQRHEIHIAPSAASDHDGEADFFIVAADYRSTDPRRGMASLLRRPGEWAPVAVSRVRTERLDTFLRQRACTEERIALWIDAEGMAHQVLAGSAGCAAAVRMVHVEVETAPCVAPGQRLYPQVHTLLAQMGFDEVATDQHPGRQQFNALFIRNDMPWPLRASLSVWRERVRYLSVMLLRQVCPGCLRSLVRLRARLRHSSS